MDETASSRSYAALVRRVRLSTGVVMFSYVTTHLLNHSLGLIGLDALAAGLRVFQAFWRNPLCSIVLYASIITHFLLALWALYQRRHLRMSRWEGVQLMLGLAIPALLIPHAIGARLGHELYDTIGSYPRVLHRLWSQPESGLKQMALLLAAWTHGCIGLRYSLSLKPWYPRYAGTLAALAILLPTLALAGFAHGLHEVSVLAQRAGWVREMIVTSKGASAAQRMVLAGIADASMLGFAACLALTLTLRWLRNVIERHRHSIRVGYPGGREVVAPVGYSLLEVSRFAGIPHASVCGGRGRCSTCRVRIARGVESLPPPSGAEQKVLNRVGAPPGVRLACQLRPVRDVSVIPLLRVDARARDGFARPAHVPGQERQICVLFADLRGFTRFAERKLPYDVVFFLNRYFDLAGDVIERSGGVVNQFFGDGLMALFGVESGPEEGCRAALAAAVALVDAVADLSNALGDADAPALTIGIGIHTGPAVVGSMGRGVATYLTAIGDTVNLSSRLQELSKQYQCPLILSEAVARCAGVDVSAFARHELAVRNRSEPVVIHAVDRLELLAAAR